MLKSNQKSKENITKQIKKMRAFENLLNKKVSNGKKFLKLVKKESKLNAKNRAKADELVK